MNHIEELLQKFEDVIGPELSAIIDLISQDPDSRDSYHVEIPEMDSVDLTTENLASLVARTSNNYGRVARFCGMARAMMKIHEAQYKRAYKKALGQSTGSNQAAREAYASDASTEQNTSHTLYRSMVELAESMEDACRIASESSRKIFDKQQNMLTAYNREQSGHYQESDFSDPNKPTESSNTGFEF